MDGLVSGMFFEVFNLLKKELNFTATMYKRGDGQWGALNPDGVTWSGMISDILAEKADMIVGSLTLSKQRFEVVDYLAPIGLETHSLVIASVSKEEVSWSTYGAPFKPRAWFVLIVISLLFAIFIHIAQKAISKKYRTTKDPQVIS